MVYSKQTWTDGSGGGTPLSAARLTVMENGIEAADLHVRPGAGSPEGTIVAPVGELWTNTTDGVLFTKQTGTGNTGWVVVTSTTTGLASVTVADLPAGSVLNVAESGGAYTRPTARTDLTVIFTGVSDPGAAALDGDKWDRLP